MRISIPLRHTYFVLNHSIPSRLFHLSAAKKSKINISMSVRYAPTNTLVKHIDERIFERIKFIVIDDDLSASFTSKNLAGVNPHSDKFRRYRLPQPQDEEFRENHNMDNTEQVVSYRDNLTEKNKLFSNLHNCYHPTQVSQISKFVCWSQGPLVLYKPKIALIFEVGGPIKKVQEFNWNDTPKASVFMCNNNGEIKKLAFRDARVSGVEFISLGKPAPISSCGDTASFLSLIPGNERAEEIFETIMDKTALEIQRARWGISSSMVFSSSESNSDDDGNSLRLKPRTSKKVTWDDEPSQPSNSRYLSLSIIYSQIHPTNQNSIVDLVRKDRWKGS